MSVFSVSLSLRYFAFHITRALVFSPDTLAEIPEGSKPLVLKGGGRRAEPGPTKISVEIYGWPKILVLAPEFCDYTKTLPHPCVHANSLPARFLNTKLLFLFFRFVLFFLLSLVVKDTELQLHPRHEEISRLRRL